MSKIVLRSEVEYSMNCDYKEVKVGHVVPSVCGLSYGPQQLANAVVVTLAYGKANNVINIWLLNHFDVNAYLMHIILSSKITWYLLSASVDQMCNKNRAFFRHVSQVR